MTTRDTDALSAHEAAESLLRTAETLLSRFPTTGDVLGLSGAATDVRYIEALLRQIRMRGGIVG